MDSAGQPRQALSGHGRDGMLRPGRPRRDLSGRVRVGPSLVSQGLASLAAVGRGRSEPKAGGISGGDGRRAMARQAKLRCRSASRGRQSRGRAGSASQVSVGQASTSQGCNGSARQVATCCAWDGNGRTGLASQAASCCGTIGLVEAVKARRGVPRSGPMSPDAARPPRRAVVCRVLVRSALASRGSKGPMAGGISGGDGKAAMAGTGQPC